MADDDATPRAVEPTQDQAMAGSRPSKRSLFSFSKKKSPPPDSHPSVTSNPSSPPNEPASKVTTSTTASSPPRALSTSPRLSSSASPARSQIFERDVQEPVDATQKLPASPAIPTHIQTEDYIPAALDGASEIITDGTLDPESVEIVTHSHHVPALAGTTEGGAEDRAGWQEEMDRFEDGREARSMSGVLSADNASHYGSLMESADVRRLSFVSFADVVQSEHPAYAMSGALPSPGSSESVQMASAGLTSLSPSRRAARSPSPVSSPGGAVGAGMSPPTSNPGSIKGLEMSPGRKLSPPPSQAAGTQWQAGGGAGGPQSGQGDLKVETMGQALRKMGSTDLSTARSAPQSPVDSGASAKGMQAA